jgi:uncharacterized membrane protein YedE/YeeE
MIRSVWALLSGAVFGLGLAISEMINPAKVLAFLDVAGRWDPSLALVMAGALAVTLISFHLILRRPAPLLGGGFEVPSRRNIDRPLVAGAALFGIGWGLVGYCPGPAIASVVFGHPKSFVFIVAMILGAWLYHASGRIMAASSPAPIAPGE